MNVVYIVLSADHSARSSVLVLKLRMNGAMPILPVYGFMARTEPYLFLP